MELTVEIARRTETGEQELLTREDVAVEGLESEEQLERPLYLDIHVRMRTEEPEATERVEPAGQEPESPLLRVQVEPAEPEPAGESAPPSPEVVEAGQPSEREAEDLLIEAAQEGAAEEEAESAEEAEPGGPVEAEPGPEGAAAQVSISPTKRMDSTSGSPVLEVVEEAIQPVTPEAGTEGAPPAEAEPAPGAAAEAESPVLEVSEFEVTAPSADTAEEFAQQLAGTADSVPQPSVSANDAALRQAAGGGAGAMRRHREGLRPEQVLDPRPVPPEPPAATTENPVPHALWIIDRASQSRLTDQTPPSLIPTPRGNTPRLGDRERSGDEMQAVTEFGRSYQERADQAQQSQCSFELELGMSLAPLSPEEEEIRELYSRMRQAPTQSIQPEPPQAIVTQPEPPIVPPLRRAEPTDVARVFSYLLAQPEQAARDALIDVRRGMAPANTVGIEFPTLGDDRVAALAGELDRDFRDMAQQAGASAEQLDQAIETRRRELEEEAQRRLMDTEQSFADASQFVCEEAAVTTAAVDAGASAMTEHADEVCTAAQEVDPNTEALATQDRLLTQARERSAGYNVYYRRMGERRESVLNSTERAYISAYTYAKQRDEVQIYDDPSLTDEQREEENTALRAWLAGVTGAVGLTFTAFRGSATIQISRFNSDLEQATREAFAEIRDWAAARMGMSRDFEQQLQDDAADWDVQVQANADAWRAVENGRQAAEANRYIEFYAGLRDAASDETRQQAVLGNQQLNNNQRMIAAAYFGRSMDPETGLPTDPVNLIANGIRNRFMAVRHANLSAELRTEMLASEDWRRLGRVGSALRPPADIEERARRIYERGLHGGMFGGNEPQHVMDALTGLNDVQANALRKAYRALFGIDLETDLRREFRGFLGTSLGEERGELHQAQALLASAEAQTEEQRNEAAAQAAAAQIYAAGEGQIGTKEETIFRVLRGLSEDARKRVERIYRERYGRPLAEALRSELYDWATATTHDADRAEALRVANRELADAIAMDQALYYDFGAADREDVEAIYTTVRNDVLQEARRDGRNSTWVRMEIRRRMGRMETLYNERFEGEIVPGRETQHGGRGYGEQPYEPYRRGNLRENLGRIFPGAEGEGLTALVDGNQLAADAARIRAERASTYVSDEAVNNVLAAQYDRAREEEELDRGRALRHLETRRMQNEEEDYFRATGRFWTPEYRWERQEQLELDVERAIDRRAETRAGESMGRLAREYERQSGGEALQTVVSRYMSGTDKTAAQHMLDRGYLTTYERLRYGIEGAGTKEDLVKNALRGRTKREIEELDRQWQLDHNGETLKQALSGDLSGDDWIEAQISYEGRPMTLDQAIAIARMREELTRPRGFSEQTGMALGAVRDLENLRNQLRDPRTAMLPPEEQQAYVDLFNGQRQVVDTVIETRNSIAGEMTDAVINAVSIAAALIVGTVGSFFTAGLAGAVALAIIASLVATASSITIRAIVMRNRYGLEQFGVDVAVGVVDAMVAALTAGMGNRLLGVRQVAAMAAQRTAQAGGQAARRTILASLRQALGRQIGPLAERTRAIAFLERMAAEEAAWYSRLTAHAISQTIENTIQSIPSAVVANALNEDNYRDGHGFLNILQGVGTQVAMGVAQGLAFSAGQKIVSTGARSAWRFVRGPELGAITYRRGLAQMSAAEFEAHYRDFEQAHPGATRERFRGLLEQEQARVRERSEAQMEQRRQVRNEMNDALRSSSDPEISALAGMLDDIPITRLNAAEYARVAGIGAPDVVVIERRGQMHIVMREGASPAAIRQHAAALAARVEPGTGGRVKNLADALPRDLRDAVRIAPGRGLRPREVRVYPFPDVHIVAGPGATAADIRLHLRVARALVRLQGAHGRVLQMLERIRIWTFEHGTPGPRTKAFEAHFEVRKLPEIFRARQAELANPDLHPSQRIEIEASIRSLFEQLERHSRTLAEFDVNPGRGFIAEEGIPERQRAYKEAVREDVEGYSRTPLDPDDAKTRSPLYGQVIEGRGRVEQVNRVGETWKEWGRVDGVDKFLEYRVVEGLDAQGRRIALYEENLNKQGQWVMRGEEIAGKGRVGERASRLHLQDSIRRARGRGRPDFLIDAQNASNQGFDKVRIQFEAGDAIPVKGGGYRLRDGAAPTLVIGEDKLMARVSYESITAIRENLVKNLDRLQQHLDDGTATLPREKGGLGLTDFQAEALAAALERGKLRFELRVFSERSLGDPSGKTPLQRETMILPRLKEEIITKLQKSGRPWLQDRDVSVARITVKSYLRKARAAIDLENRIGHVPSVHERAADMKLSTSDPQQLHRAFVSIIGEAANQPAALRLRTPAYDTVTGLIFDAAGPNGRAILSTRVDASDVRSAQKSAKLAEAMLQHAISTPKHPDTGSIADPVSILDLSGLSSAEVISLQRAIARRFAGRNQLGRLPSILVFTDQQPELRIFVPASEVPKLLGRRKGAG